MGGFAGGGYSRYLSHVFPKRDSPWIDGVSTTIYPGVPPTVNELASGLRKDEGWSELRAQTRSGCASNTCCCGETQKEKRGRCLMRGNGCVEGNERGVNMTVWVWIEKAVTDESPTIIRAAQRNKSKSVTERHPGLKKLPNVNDELLNSKHEFICFYIIESFCQPFFQHHQEFSQSGARCLHNRYIIWLPGLLNRHPPSSIPKASVSCPDSVFVFFVR